MQLAGLAERTAGRLQCVLFLGKKLSFSNCAWYDVAMCAVLTSR
jgi:hypothetical protein